MEVSTINNVRVYVKQNIICIAHICPYFPQLTEVLHFCWLKEAAFLIFQTLLFMVQNDSK